MLIVEKTHAGYKKALEWAMMDKSPLASVNLIAGAFDKSEEIVLQDLNDLVEAESVMGWS